MKEKLRSIFRETDYLTEDVSVGDEVFDELVKRVFDNGEIKECKENPEWCWVYLDDGEFEYKIVDRCENVKNRDISYVEVCNEERCIRIWRH